MGCVERVWSSLETAFLGYRAAFIWLEPRTFILVRVIEPALQMTFFVMLGGHFLGPDHLPFLVAGNAVRLCTVSCLFGVVVMMRVDRRLGTLGSIMGTPGAGCGLFAWRSMIQVADGLITIALGLIIGRLVFGVSFPAANPATVILAASTAAFSVAGLGLLVGAAALISTDINLVMNVVNGLLLALTGVTVPLGALPAAVLPIAGVLPLTRGVQAVRLGLSGSPPAAVGSLIMGEAVVGGLYLALALAALTAVSWAAKTTGTLDLY